MARIPYRIVDTRGSRSFPFGDPHPFLEEGTSSADVVVVIGTDPDPVMTTVGAASVVLVELGTECLGVHTGEGAGQEGSNILGFARYRVGDDPPSNLVELVHQPQTEPEARATAKALFEQAGFQVAECRDSAGRILDRLIRPYWNAALTALDEGLATAEDMDTTVKLGLGYPAGPIELLERSGLHHHHDVTAALFETYGTRHYAPARRAVVAKARARKADADG